MEKSTSILPVEFLFTHLLVAYNLATSIGKSCCNTFYCMKGNVALKIGPMTSYLSVWKDAI